MNIRSILPFFYFKNYYSFVFFGSLLVIVLSIPLPHNIHKEILSLRKYVEIPMIYVLSVLAVLNIFMYIKSFFDKTYRTVTISLFPIYVMIFLKFSHYILVFGSANAEGNLTEDWFEIANCYYIMQMTALVCLVGLFIFLSIKGIFYHLLIPVDKYHWINDHLDTQQLNKSKRLDENGKIVSVYFKGFLLNEIDKSVIIRNHKLELNAFRDYITLNNLKLDDLNDDELKVIEMLGI